MTRSRGGLAAALLAAQVEWVIDEVTGPRLTAVVERDVDALLEMAANHRIDELVDPDDAKVTARRVIAIARDSEVVANLAVELAVKLHSLPESSEHRLADVVDRDDVEALVAALLTMDRLHRRSLDRIEGSPLVGVVASGFVTRLVADVLQQNSTWAKKVPGVTSLFSMGGSAVGKIRGVADKQAEMLLGDVTGRGGEFAIRRTNAALLGLVGEAPLHGAAMESWDLQAAEPMSDLTDYLVDQDVRHLAELVLRLIARSSDSAYAGVTIDAFVDVFFEQYGGHDVATFLDEVGVTRDDLVIAVERHARPVVDELRESGELDSLVRSWLEPFYSSKSVKALLKAPRP